MKKKTHFSTNNPIFILISKQYMSLTKNILIMKENFFSF